MRKVRWVLVFVLLVMLLGTVPDVALSQEPLVKAVSSSAPGTTTIAPHVQKHVLSLAGRFLYEDVDDQARASILDDIRALSEDEARLFMDFVFAIQMIGFPEDNPSFSDSVVRPQRQAYVLDLASRAIYDEVDNETSRRIQEEIEALPIDEHQFLANLAAAIQSIGFPDPNAPYVLPKYYLKTREALLTLAEANGVSVVDLNLPDTEIKAALLDAKAESPIASCPPGYAMCTYISFTGTTYRGYCTGGGCITGYGYDRITEDPSGCELAGCDYRVWFFTPSDYRGIDGVTAAADCVADRGPHAHRWIGRTDDEFGFGTVTGCLIFSGDYLRQNMRVQS